MWKSGNHDLNRSISQSRFAILFTFFPGALRPQGGPIMGGTHIDLHGHGFREDSSENIKCKFGRLSIVAATYHNPERVSCITPPFAANVEVPLEVAFNEQIYTSDTVIFYVFTLHNSSGTATGAVTDVVAVSSIHPEGGPSSGMYPVIKAL